MEFREINFAALESVRKQCITFAKDGNTVVKPYKTLYNMEQITHDPAHSNLYVEVVKDRESWEYGAYCLWDDLGKICVCAGNLNGETTLEYFSEAVSKYEYLGKDGLFKRLKVSEDNGYYINKIDIELCIIFGEIELAKHYAEYRGNRIAAQKAKEQAEIAEREAREKAEKERHLAEMEKTILEAENTIRTHGMLYNEEFEGSTIILYLLKKYGVNVPLKTQGWVNKALAKVWYRDGEITYNYYKTSRDSTVFYEYLKELEEKILAA